MKRKDTIEDVIEELNNAFEMHPPFTSPHEGYAILKEEVDELWEEIKKKPQDRSRLKMRQEAKQVAAMAMRFMMELG